MKMDLKHVHAVRRKLADGTTRTYYYAWRGGPRIDAEPRTTAFVDQYRDAHENRNSSSGGDFSRVSGLIDQYTASPEFDELRRGSRDLYMRNLEAIRCKFGTLRTAGLNDPRIRTHIIAWRDSLRSTPAAADQRIRMLRTLLSWAVDRRIIGENHATKIKHLSRANPRAEIVWTQGQIDRLGMMPEHIRNACLLALWTGQRQGDLLSMTWGMIEGDHIVITQAKTGNRAIIYVCQTLRDILNALPRTDAVTILTNSRGRPWISSGGFKSSQKRAFAAAGIEGVTFHDLRGTFENRLWEAGCTEAEAYTVTGRAIQSAQSANAYFARQNALSTAAMTKLEAKFGGLPRFTVAKIR